jgi:hypothetical protein
LESSIRLLRPPTRRPALQLAGLAVLVAGVVALVVHFTGTGSVKPLPPAPGVNEPVADQSALTPDARQVANAFIMTAVARRNTGASWELLDPTYEGKSEFTKATWAKGDIPVIPTGYPFRQEDVTLTVKDVYPRSIMLEALIIPRNNARATTFDLSLKAHGSDANRGWLVDYWMTGHDNGVPGSPK